MVRTPLALALVLAAGVSGCRRSSPSPDAFAGELAKRVTVDADGGNRAFGTAGYDASVDYVANALRAKGFDVATPDLEVKVADNNGRRPGAACLGGLNGRITTPSPGRAFRRADWVPVTRRT
jgi:hypothetical protein